MERVAWDEMVTVGRIARPHGIRGHVIVNPETDFPESRFCAGAELWVERDGRIARITIESVRFHHGRPILGLAGVATMNEAGTLAGAELRVPAAALQALADGEFYRHDLVGCRVALVDGTPVGTVRRVEGDRSSSRLVVEAGDEEVLVPLAVEICVRIDPAAGEIVIEPPEGLLALNRRGHADRHRHDLPADGRGAARREPAGTGDRAGPAGREGPRSARLHERPPPRGR